MDKWNLSTINTGCWEKYKVGDTGVPKDWWDIAQDQFFCRVHSKDPYPVTVDKLSKESFNKAHEILCTAIKEFDISKAAIHQVGIWMI